MLYIALDFTSSVSNTLKQDGIFVSPGGVRSIWLWPGLETFKKRLKAMEKAAADLLNDQVLPWDEEHSLRLLQILRDRGTEYNGLIENHEYQLYLAIEDIDHSKTKAHHPQTNGICEHFHRTIKEEFYDTAFRKKIYTSLDELQADLDQWMADYNAERPHSSKYCNGRTPHQTFSRTKHLAAEKMIDTLFPKEVARQKPTSFAVTA